TVRNSTITNNTAQGANGGGIDLASGSGTIAITSSIVSGNVNATSPDIFSGGKVNVNDSAIGSKNGFTLTGAKNLAFGTNLKLGPLDSNGGPTKTHGLIISSPCVDAGSNAQNFLYDQRGKGFARVDADGKADIGAYEGVLPQPVAISVA